MHNTQCVSPGVGCICTGMYPDIAVLIAHKLSTCTTQQRLSLGLPQEPGAGLAKCGTALGPCQRQRCNLQSP